MRPHIRIIFENRRAGRSAQEAVPTVWRAAGEPWSHHTVMGVDATVGAGSDFKELTRRMGAGLPKRYRENLERAASLKGKKYGAQ